MKLQFAKLSDNSWGYISTLNNFDELIVCKPVDTDSYDKILNDLKANPAFTITPVSPNEGFLNEFIVTENK